MSFLVALSLSTGICCGIWALIASFTSLKLITWIGFAGCTAYFASGKHGFEGMKTAFFALMSGVASAFVAVLISSKFPTVGGVAILMTAIISGTMCYQSKLKELWFIPGGFLGMFLNFRIPIIRWRHNGTWNYTSPCISSLWYSLGCIM